MIPYALQLYERLLAGGEAEILSELRKFDPEHVYLDFKRPDSAPSLYTRASGATLDKRDLANFGKSLSGFSNSRGGVIVWGIECVGNDPMARGIRPGLENADAFAGLLLVLQSKATEPPLEGIQIDVVRLPSLNGRDAVITYVPQREYGPVRCTLGEKESDKYFFRAGESFHAVPHDILASMFGRTPPPEVVFVSNVTGGLRPFVDSGDSPLIVRQAFLLRNMGQGMAYHPYLNVSITRIPSTTHISVDGLEADKFFKTSVLNLFHTFIGDVGVPLPPGATIGVCTVTLGLIPPFDGPLEYEVSCGAVDSLAFRRTYQMPLEVLSSLRAMVVKNPKLTTSEAMAVLFPLKA